LESQDCSEKWNKENKRGSSTEGRESYPNRWFGGNRPGIRADVGRKGVEVTIPGRDRKKLDQAIAALSGTIREFCPLLGCISSY
jgi:hypothetical protein